MLLHNPAVFFHLAVWSIYDVVAVKTDEFSTNILFTAEFAISANITAPVFGRSGIKYLAALDTCAVFSFAFDY